jgi:signal transduction histidine kinase
VKTTRSVFFKNYTVTVCMFAVCFAVFGLTMLIMGRAFLVREKQDSLYANVEEVKSFAEAIHEQNGLQSFELRMNLSVIARCTGNHIFLCQTDGLVVSSSDNRRVSPYIGEQVDEAIIQQLAQDGTYEGLTTLNGFYDSTRYVVAEPLESWDGDMVGYVFVSYAGDGLFGVWKGFAMMFVVVALCVLLLAILFEYYNAKRLARPLHEMAAAADRFAHGDYSARVTPYEEADEIGTLTDAFNAMATSLEQNETRRREFVANVSHELRTPMTSISGFADGILDGTIPPEEERRYLETISSETKRLSRLVRSMLDMSRLQNGDPSLREGRFDLGEMVVQTVLNFEERVDAKRLNMELNMPEDRIFVRGDIDSLTRVVYNLMDNAVKFANEGTDLTVSLWKEGGKAYTSVQDVGAEIPSEELSRIFERFHKADRSRGQDKDGVGLGLYMVRQIVAAHDQDIFVTSQNGVTAFTFTLALAENDEQKH